MRKKKIIQWMSIILLLIYAVIFVIMLVNLGMMQQAAEDMSSGVLATTRAAVYYALIHGGCNLCFNAMALLSLKYRKLQVLFEQMLDFTGFSGTRFLNLPLAYHSFFCYIKFAIRSISSVSVLSRTWQYRSIVICKEL